VADLILVEPLGLLELPLLSLGLKKLLDLVAQHGSVLTGLLLIDLTLGEALLNALLQLLRLLLIEHLLLLLLLARLLLSLLILPAQLLKLS
jgi:hypothetical protein